MTTGSICSHRKTAKHCRLLEEKRNMATDWPARRPAKWTKISPEKIIPPTRKNQKDDGRWTWEEELALARLELRTTGRNINRALLEKAGPNRTHEAIKQHRSTKAYQKTLTWARENPEDDDDDDDIPNEDLTNVDTSTGRAGTLELLVYFFLVISQRYLRP